eukprot:Lankesteria_metandrocarpae@DN2040_c0_g1_i1.p1
MVLELACADPLPIEFKDSAEYHASFIPLLLEECRCTLKQEATTKRLSPFIAKVSGGTSDAPWINFLVILQKAESIHDDPVCHEGDLIIMIPNYQVGDDPSPALAAKSSLDGQFLSDVINVPRHYGLAIYKRVTGMSTSNKIVLKMPVTVAEKLKPAVKGTMPTFRCYVVASLTTITRELTAIFKAPIQSKLFQECLLSPAGLRHQQAVENLSPNGSTREKLMSSQLLTEIEVEPYVQRLMQNEHLNPSQIEALRTSVTSRSGVALIQGPPGTGKTKTLLGILSVLNDHLEKQNAIAAANGSTETAPYKTLVCAPSNAAVDEIACRLLREGLLDFNSPVGSNKRRVPVCVRYARATAVTRAELLPIVPSVVASTLGQTILMNFSSRMQALNKAISRCDPYEYAKLNALKEEERLNMHRSLKESIEAIALEDGFKPVDAIIRASNIVLCTLSNAAGGALQGYNFRCAIIDEAAQAVEPSTVIPLAFRSLKNLILIGDTKQLPATVHSSLAMKYNYDRSLFERLEMCGVHVSMLNTQYRMRPEISKFPSGEFYRGLIQDDISVRSRPRDELQKLFGPLKFFDLPFSKEERDSSTFSISNYPEAYFVASLVALLCKLFVNTNMSSPNTTAHNGASADCPELYKEKYNRSHVHSPTSSSGMDSERCTPIGLLKLSDIGVVTPYRQQVVAINTELERLVGPGLTSLIEVSTVDSYQGREKRVIIMSCVRAASDNFRFSYEQSEAHVIGFLSDVRRLNVAMTRAKDVLWVVGHARTLQRSRVWYRALEHWRGHNISQQQRPLRAGDEKFCPLMRSSYTILDGHEPVDTFVRSAESTFKWQNSDRLDYRVSDDDFCMWHESSCSTCCTTSSSSGVPGDANRDYVELDRRECEDNYSPNRLYRRRSSCDNSSRGGTRMRSYSRRSSSSDGHRR